MSSAHRLLPAALLALAGCSVPPPAPPGDVTYSVNGAVDSCAEGAERCVGTLVQACVRGSWSNGEDCQASNSACSLAAGAATCGPQSGNVTLPSIALTAARGGPGAALINPGSDANPSVMQDGNLHLWWQGTVGGASHILYAEAHALDGPWHAHGTPADANAGASASVNDVLQPSTAAGAFDASGVGSPSVLHYANVLYMFYEGSAAGQSAIGVATSLDGVTWTRANNGQPIVGSAKSGAGGAQHPSVLWLAGHFYLLYSDTHGSGNVNGAGLYVMRATDPLFTQNLEELTAKGFAPASGVPHSGYALLATNNADWFYIDALDVFGVAVGNANDTTLILFNQALTRVGAPLTLPVAGNAAPGILTRPDRHALPHAQCSAVPFDLLRATGDAGSPDSWELTHSGRDLSFTLPCAQIPVGRVYDNAQITPASGTATSVVTANQRILVDLAATADVITRNRYGVSDDLYARIPQVAHITAGMGGYTSDSRPGGFYDGVANLFLPLGCQAIAVNNTSNLVSIPSQQYDALKSGPALYCTP